MKKQKFNQNVFLAEWQRDRKRGFLMAGLVLIGACLLEVLWFMHPDVIFSLLFAFCLATGTFLFGVAYSFDWLSRRFREGT